MKIFKLKKSSLVWKEMGQIDYKWVLPILVNNKKEVVAGNSLFNSLSDEILVCVIEKNQILEDTLYYVESKIYEEGKIERVGKIDCEIRGYFKELRRPTSEQLSLFEEPKECRCISEENYKRPNAEITYSHGRKSDEIERQLYLFEEENEEIINDEENDIKIDLEILKELL